MLLSRHQNAGPNNDTKTNEEIVWKCVTVHIFGDDSNKSNLPRRKVDHSPPTSAEVKKTSIYIFTAPYAFMA
jgi:hypothetical protein